MSLEIALKKIDTITAHFKQARLQLDPVEIWCRAHGVEYFIYWRGVRIGRWYPDPPKTAVAA